MRKNLWTREEEIIVFNLYCKIPFQRSSKDNPEVIRIAKLIGRSPSAVNMKIGNFGSFDETLKQRGIVGLMNASKLDEQIWNEFNGDWDRLAFESEQLIADLQKKDIENTEPIASLSGYDKIITTKQRVNQNFFRQSVLSAYRNTCCITGLNNSQLLIASHIKPWSKSNNSEKTNPSNGLCLNALHDKAFDVGLITVTPDYKIHVSKLIKDIYNGETVEKFFGCYDNTKIMAPEKFAPAKEFLIYHNDLIFERGNYL
ncbi:MAG: HNH endonuclease [Selenomonadaceae bacterium]|nr:HNH endonuclease [Selenomonadaceae bacterium]